MSFLETQFGCSQMLALYMYVHVYHIHMVRALARTCVLMLLFFLLYPPGPCLPSQL